MPFMTKPNRKTGKINGPSFEKVEKGKSVRLKRSAIHERANMRTGKRTRT